MTRADDPAPARPECPITTEITSRGLIAILRAPTAEHFPAIAATLLDAGIHAIEITLTTHGACGAFVSSRPPTAQRRSSGRGRS